jgi:ankyrin repeat protein
MHIAAFFDSLDCFIYLERKGLSLSQESAASYLPLHYACYNNSYEVVCYIIRREPRQASLISSVEWHLLYLATVGGDPEILLLLLRNGADLSLHTGANAPIPQAIRKRNVPCLRILLAHNVKNVRSADYTSLMLAISSNEPKAIPLLLDSGEDPGFITAGYESALSLACFQGESWIETVRLICDRVTNIDLDPTLKEKAAIHWACSSKSPEIVRIILEKGVDVNRVDSKEKSGLYYLLDNCSEDVVIEIMELMVAHGFDVRAHPAAVIDFVQAMSKPCRVIEWLFEHGADPAGKANGKKVADTVNTAARANMHIRRIAAKWVGGKR